MQRIARIGSNKVKTKISENSCHSLPIFTEARELEARIAENVAMILEGEL